MKKKTFEDHINEEGSWFVAVTHDLSLADKIKTTILDFPSWAWIYHEADTEDGTPHIHFMLRSNGTRKIKHIADKIDLPANYIQICKNQVGFRRYMLHLDSDDKIKYSLSDVHTNQHTLFREAINANKTESDIFQLYEDYCKLYAGVLNPKQFIQNHCTEMEKMPFGQKIKTFQIINEEYGHQHALT